MANHGNPIWERKPAPTMICRVDDTGRRCYSEKFRIVKFQDGVHLVCLRCEREYTIAEVVASANEV